MNRFLSETPVGIRFGDYVFSEPAPLGRFSVPPRSAGLYVILMPDPSWGPWQLQPLFFGEYGGLCAAQMSPAQQICCLRVAAGRTLYAAMCAVPQQYGREVSHIRKELIDSYHPIANVESVNAAEMGYRLESLEKRILEQDAMLKMALAAIAQTVQLQPERKRKIVGFQPYPANSPEKSLAANYRCAWS
jgi:hypothetical protein